MRDDPVMERLAAIRCSSVTIVFLVLPFMGRVF